MSQLKVNTIRHTGASSDAVTLASDGTCTAKITNNLSNRNLIINGAMQIAQRGTSSTTSLYQTVDRFQHTVAGADEAITTSWHDLTSSDTGPWAKGFRKSWHIQNGNQTGGAGSGDYLIPQYAIEAQDLANSGWDYKSASSYITLSFWVKSSVAQTFYGFLRTLDGTSQAYSFNYALSANTWTKVTKTIPGNSNIDIDNNNEAGMSIFLPIFMGTDRTNSGNTEGTWAAYSGSNRTKDSTTTWWTTNDATWELTGVQLEVGDVATDFEHRSYGDELARCQRYYQKIDLQEATGYSNRLYLYWQSVSLNTTMRATPTLADNSNYGVDTGDLQTFQAGDYTTTTDGCIMDYASPTSITVRGSNGNAYHWIRGRVHVTAEL